MTSKYWDKESDFYDRQWKGSPSSEFDYLCTKNLLLHMLKPSVSDSMLEIGCGLGMWTCNIGNKCRKITAIDISKDMIRKAKKNANMKNAKFIVSDFISFKSREKFNKIFAVRSFEYLGDIEDGLRGVKKMLLPGGKFVIITKSMPCAWDLVYHEKWKRSGFKQNKISFIKLRKLLHYLGFINIEMYPVIIRLPIFRGGNAEIPLVPNSLAKYILAPGHVLNKFRQAVIFSESYGICATAGEP
ncbi:MAG TPA: class I SAM-dependent methyltransferase [Candidatus Aenigmarchaeota archaeon]|nr:class I SAM-dependent methyltransferase [Candidatus Aenigmarchaeota archaeon]